MRLIEMNKARNDRSDLSSASLGTAVALHCSGADAGQWRALAEGLAPDVPLVAPEHYGTASAGSWPGHRAFTLAEEAERSLRLVDAVEGKVHLVGHSYGGAVALHLALTRPDKTASLSLYEPSAFHLLKSDSAQGGTAFAEIAGVAQRVGEGVLSGDYETAMAGFVDYWNGSGAWRAMKPGLQASLRGLAPKVALDFAALFGATTEYGDYAALEVPVLLLRGERALYPSRRIVEILTDLLPRSRVKIVDGAGHMGPMTHAESVNGHIVEHIRGGGGATARSVDVPIEGLSSRSVLHRRDTAT